MAGMNLPGRPIGNLLFLDVRDRQFSPTLDVRAAAPAIAAIAHEPGADGLRAVQLALATIASSDSNAVITLPLA